MMDFTIGTYKLLLASLKKNGFTFQTFEDFLSVPLNGKVVVLRHDIDRRPQNALRLSQIEHCLGIKASYYIRIVKSAWNQDIMKKIVALGHELGYHYEDMTIAKGHDEKAWDLFKLHLAKVREYYPVRTICMHGSPLSKWDNRKLWEKYDYRKEGIIGEPYSDVDYLKVFYITDTGRAWNKIGASLRDKVIGGLQLEIKDTAHLIRLIDTGNVPEKLIINTHPQRWFNFGFNWIKELVYQNMKNLVKMVFLSYTHKRKAI